MTVLVLQSVKDARKLTQTRRVREIHLWLTIGEDEKVRRLCARGGV